MTSHYADMQGVRVVACMVGWYQMASLYMYQMDSCFQSILAKV